MTTYATWTKESAVQRMSENATLQWVVSIEPRVKEVLALAIQQRPCKGYNRIDRHYELKQKIQSLVGFSAKDVRVKTMKHYDAVMRTIDDLLPPDRADVADASFIEKILYFSEYCTDAEIAELMRVPESSIRQMKRNEQKRHDLFVKVQSNDPKSTGLSRRFMVLRRDGYRCQLCGRSAADGAVLEVDHKTPKAKGGGDEWENLWSLCFDCNRGKRDHDL